MAQRAAPRGERPDAPPKPAPAAAVSAADAATGLVALLKLEAEVRDASTPESLRFLIAAETRKLTRARQIFVVDLRRGRPVIAAASGMPAVDRSAPFIVSLERILRRMNDRHGLRASREAEISTYAEGHETDAVAYPFRCLSWLPFPDTAAQPMGGMLLLREEPWQEQDLVIARRLAGTYAHALRALAPRRRRWLGAPRGAMVLAAALAVAAATLIVPVPLTTLAPFEIVPAGAFVVAAPIEGILDDVVVEPNAQVRAGDVLVRFADTTLKNRLEVANRELAVAESRLRKSTQLAFTDVRGRHDLAVAMSEVELKSAERDAARDLLDRAVVRAQRDGIAVFADKKQLVGKPMAVGERIMQIADPAEIEVAVDVAVGDAIVLRPGARAKVFLDSDPLHPRAAVVAAADHRARVRPGNQLAFRVTARFDDGAPTPRLGVRGTAQLYGDDVSLAFFLFRRPLAALRQWTGL